jgi:hypothetical protein
VSYAETSNRRFEQAIVLLFIAAPPVGGLVLLYQALQDITTFGKTVAWLAYLVMLVGLHIKFVRPIFRRYPWVAGYGEIAERAKKLKARHPKLVNRALARRILRSTYRFGYFFALVPFFLGMYALHGHEFVWFVGGWMFAGLGITVGHTPASKRLSGYVDFSSSWEAAPCRVLLANG